MCYLPPPIHLYVINFSLKIYVPPSLSLSYLYQDLFLKKDC